MATGVVESGRPRTVSGRMARRFGPLALALGLVGCAVDPAVMEERRAKELEAHRTARGQSPRPSSPVAAVPREPALVDLEASPAPRRVRRGDVLDLRLVYELAAPPGQSAEVTEERRLSFAGQVLPNYPVTARFSRGAGRYTTNYAQPVPSSAALGVYELRAEVCLAGRCLVRITAIEAVP